MIESGKYASSAELAKAEKVNDSYLSRVLRLTLLAPDIIEATRLDDIRKVPAAIRFVSLEPLIGSVAAGNLTNINWAIVGGESGPRAREMNPKWVDEIEVMCRQSGTAFFFKQWGGKNKKAAGRLLRGRTFDEMPVQISP